MDGQDRVIDGNRVFACPYAGGFDALDGSQLIKQGKHKLA